MSNTLEITTYADLLALQNRFATKAVTEVTGPSGTVAIPTSKQEALALVKDGAEFRLDDPAPGTTRKERGSEERIAEDRRTIVVLFDLS